MKALITHGDGKIECVDCPMPVIGEYDCLVKVYSCLFCNSTDRHIVENSFHFGIPYPCVLGHESIGQVIQVGAKVRNFAVGDQVARPYALYPDEVNGGFGSGWGGFAEYGKVRDYRAMVADGAMKADAVPGFFLYMQKIPADIPLEMAMLLSCQKEIYSSTCQIGTDLNRRFLIAGAGIAGLLFAIFLKRLGAREVTVAARRREALEFAALHTPADATELFAELGGNYDALIDTTGNAELARRLLTEKICPNGDFYSYAVYRELGQPGFFDQLTPPGIQWHRIDPAEAAVHDEVIAMLRDGSLDCRPFITSRITIEEAPEAWEKIRDQIKTAVVFP